MNKESEDSKDVCYYGHASKFARREKILHTKPFPLLANLFGYNVHLLLSNDFVVYVSKLWPVYLFLFPYHQKSQQTAPLRDQNKVMKLF